MLAVEPRRGEAIRLGARIANSSISERPSRASSKAAVSQNAGERRIETEKPGQWPMRDAWVEDELFSNGELADVVFLCAGPPPMYNPKEIFGQAALFALLSPVLKDVLFPIEDPATSVHGTSTVDLTDAKRDNRGRREIWLADKITVRGFKEVARYVYRLQPKFALSSTAEVVAAARILKIPEFDRGVIIWGLAQFEALAPSRGQRKFRPYPTDAEDQGGNICSDPTILVADALRCFAVLCLPLDCTWEPKHASAIAWRESMLKAFESEEISSSVTFLELSEEALLLLLENEEMHSNPADLWEKCISWARKRKTWEQPPQKQPAFCVGPKFAALPRKLFVPGARLVTISAPEPSEQEVDWQRWLLKVAEITRFNEMPAGIFAAHMESVSPMLPELRQVIYRVRRQGIQKASDPLQKLLRECA